MEDETEKECDCNACVLGVDNVCGWCLKPFDECEMNKEEEE